MRYLCNHCKLRMILPSRVRRVEYDLMKDTGRKFLIILVVPQYYSMNASGVEWFWSIRYLASAGMGTVELQIGREGGREGDALYAQETAEHATEVNTVVDTSASTAALPPTPQ